MVPAADRMRERGRGHVVVIASVTSYFGWPAAAAYGASKAALVQHGEIAEIRFRQASVIAVKGICVSGGLFCVCRQVHSEAGPTL